MWQLVLCVMMQLAPATERIEQARYLDAANQLRDEIRRGLDPVAVRQYTVLLVDFHVKQVLWRAFFMKNMDPGETYLEVRASLKELATNDELNLVEQNLENLLLRALQVYPDDLNVQFACAYYLDRGECCLMGARLPMDDAEVARIFRRADEQGIATGPSLFALIRDQLETPGPLDDDGLNVLKRAYRLAPYDPEISGAMLEQDLLRRDYQAALSVSRSMYDAHDFMQQRLESLHGAARAFLGLGRLEDAYRAAETGVHLAPDHIVLWMIGWDALRGIGDRKRYTESVLSYLEIHNYDPRAFEDYLAYGSDRGWLELDREVARFAESLQPHSSRLQINRDLGLGALWLNLGDPNSAKRAFVRAWESVSQSKMAPEALLEIAEQGITAAESRMEQDEQ